MGTYEQLKLDKQICFPLYALSRKVVKLYKPLLDPFGLTYTQYITLLVLWEEEAIPFKRLGERLYLDSGTLTPVINKLIAMGHVQKYRTKEDDRVVVVELTDQGKALKEQVAAVPEQLYCQFKGKTSEVQQLKQLLDGLLADMDK